MNYIDMQIATSAPHPELGQFQQWADAALAIFEDGADSELVIRLVDAEEISELNQQYRHKSGPTNILSFPFEAPAGMDMDLLGDLVICAPLIAQEASQQNKLAEHHWAHITIHGVLHLLGYDHIEDQDAEQMEALEIEILSKLGIANPYMEDGKQ
ncbi:rRNA maturation RNase YbeY [Methylomonas fluvii]|uniref:Endoribonuclease YbeY n=1 Tax=Methylomonas fluvii TaxID=1854564 RepID=A0ABR9DG92_9GAMM|nr:rRNA maturation RNase YbeY [Methylomonas fluvii]MBD9361881.1 rRNA maturation RNase YbeY [Methylomonas fluvii]CAD6874895.1 Metal-dependent hydrolase YbeY, involved in rRNA and/or ribosome maturation and assembly [Methylomonas fluvii]